MCCDPKIERSLIFNKRGKVAVTCLRFVVNDEIIMFHILVVRHLCFLLILIHNTFFRNCLFEMEIKMLLISQGFLQSFN